LLVIMVRRNIQQPIIVSLTYSHDTDWTSRLGGFHWYYKVTNAGIDYSRGKVIETASLRVDYKDDLRRVINALHRSNISIIYIREVNQGYPKYFKVILEGDVSNSTRYMAAQYGMIEVYAYYETGVEHWGFISFNSDNVRSFVNDISKFGRVLDVKVKRLGVNDLLGISALRLDMFLSPGEYRTLKYAFYRGFFDIPRGIDLDDLARELNLSKSTVNRYLRSALKKILRVIVNDNVMYSNM